MATHIDAARLLTYRSADALDRGIPNTMLASMAKRSLLMHAIRYVPTRCKSSVEQVLTRNIRGRSSSGIQRSSMYEGMSQIQRLIISRHVLAMEKLNAGQ